LVATHQIEQDRSGLESEIFPVRPHYPANDVVEYTPSMICILIQNLIEQCPGTFHTIPNGSMQAYKFNIGNNVILAVFNTTYTY